MWGDKKSHTPQALDPGLKNVKTNQSLRAPGASWERTPKMNNDAIRPTEATADRATARLGPGLHVKGEISGNEDLYIDGTVEGLVHLDERKLTIGATAKLTADIIAGEVIVYGSVKRNVRGKGKIEIEKSAEKEADKNVSSRTAAAPTAAGAEPRSI